MMWPAVARRYVESFSRAQAEHTRRRRTSFRAQTLATRPAGLPEISLKHVLAMTDDTGMLQHAIFSIPRALEGSQVLVDAEEDVGPRARTRECGHRGQGGMEQIARVTVSARVARTTDHRAERPQRPLMAVVGSARLETVDAAPTLSADPDRYPEELWGIEDPRITFVEELGRYVVAYTAFSRGDLAPPWH